MKKTIFTIGMLLISLCINAQLKFHPSGKVSIGSISSPTYKLGVTGDIDAVASGNAYRIQGYKVLWFNSTATSNIFTGVEAGNSISTGINNTFSGYRAGYSLTSGTEASAYGYKAGYSNTGNWNTFVGSYSGYTNPGATYNTFVGYASGYAMTATSATYNTFIGHNSGRFNTSGIANTFVGHQSGYNNKTGLGNTYIGVSAGYYDSTGYYNTAIGRDAMADNKITTGSSNTFLGYNTDATGNYSNSAAIGANASVNASDKIRIGDVTVNPVETQTAWTTVSDGRFKFNVQDNVKGLDFIKKLRPVNYQFDTEAFDSFLKANSTPDSLGTETSSIDYSASKAIIHSGFVAQEVEQAAAECGFTTDIVHVPADEKDNYSIAYGAMVVPLVKAVQELSATIDGLKAQPTLRKAEQKNDSLEKRIEQLENLVNQCCTYNQNPAYNNNTGENKIKGNAIPVELISFDIAILYQNIPNPFTDETTINYYLPESISSAKMLFYDDSGRIIKEMKLALKGNNSIVVNSTKLSNGIYTYAMEVDGKVTDTKKMLKNK